MHQACRSLSIKKHRSVGLLTYLLLALSASDCLTTGAPVHCCAASLRVIISVLACCSRHQRHAQLATARHAVPSVQRWKSNPMYWCELCRCWMNDTKAAKLNHERGAKHQENLARSEPLSWTFTWPAVACIHGSISIRWQQLCCKDWQQCASTAATRVMHLRLPLGGNCSAGPRWQQRQPHKHGMAAAAERHML